MTLTAVIGARVRQARKLKGWTQAEMGSALGDYLGAGGWSRPAVSTAEAGGRDFRAVELLALAIVLERPIGWFFLPTEPGVPIELPGGRMLHHFPIGVVTRQFGGAAVAANAGNVRMMLRDIEDFISEVEQFAPDAETEEE
jgi:transcriptional regulator with XRE-family HTH domain